MPAIAKLFYSIFNNRLTFVKNSLNLYDPLQFTYCEKHSSTDNAFILNSLIDISAAKRKPLYVCYVDLKSAFDTVNRSALLLKLRLNGIKGKFYSVIFKERPNFDFKIKMGAKPNLEV